jgi:hypothetical protein
MWPLIVVNFDEAVEALLLLQEVERGWLGGLLVQRQMHALVSAALLWVARLDALEADAQTQPPEAELGEPEEGVAG